MEALGFNLKYFLFQLANFALLFIILRALLHKPLAKFLEDRRNEIASGLENAEKMKLALASTEAKQLEVLEEARKEARALIEESRAQAKALELKLLEDSQKKAEELLERTKEEMAAERTVFRQELRAEMAELVVHATERVLEDTVSLKEKQQHIDKLVKEIA